ncbi:MAG: DUF512 domain-containing protein [Clostridia bacterium]|nr:DUF512 domain-containing protein [Clostridia bacterium]MBQ1966992.1 DUF512 domain-containing protein [Clostridia bacterium]MBQ1996320.1 DUF512 domain-containing protein [Clostridia bacterium]
MVEIKSVIRKSPADKAGIKGGDLLLKVNSHEINDFLDYQFYVEESSLKIEYEHKGSVKSVLIKKDEYDDLGLEFETYLMDKERRCKNKCIFCFIDQNPKGMRESIYFKDDDSRLSFLFGNYITLTNLSERDVERIIEMHITPVNISVHTMNKELRVKMMKNPKAGECLQIISYLAENGISINTQLVLCPGINDGDELRYSLQKLSELHPGVESIAVVPVGITKHRDGLFEMPQYTKETAADVIDIITEFGDKFKEKFGTRLCYASDEFYLKAERPLPDAEYYEDYVQLENGVGMCTSFKDEFMSGLYDIADDTEERKLSLATGEAAYPLIKELSDEVTKKFPNIKINVYKIENNFFGHTVTVAGLVTGRDLIDQLKGKELYDRLIIPDVMLRSEGDLFLDNISVEDVEEALSVPLDVTFSADGYDLIDKIFC